MPAMLHRTPIDDALARMGSLAQCARIDSFSHEDGPMRGSRVLRAVTGGGLSFEVHPDRALDIGSLEIAGHNCAWLSPTRMAHPAYYDGSAQNFLRTFGGGFLATCGLDHTGPRCQADGEILPQHGRIGTTPAMLRRTEIKDGSLHIEGTVRQVAAMQEHLQMDRHIEAPLGGTSLTVTDTITNCSTRPQPHIVLYHCNFGWPLLSEHTRVHIDSTAAAAQTEDAAASPFAEITPPERNKKECVYLHVMKEGRVSARLENPATKLRMVLSFDSGVLPSLVQWKMLAHGVYAMGLEPTNARALGSRSKLRAEGSLPMLQPEQKVTYSLHFLLEHLV